MSIEPGAPSGASFFNALAVPGLLVAMLLVLLVTLGHVRAEESRVFKNEKGQEVGRSVTRGNTTTLKNERGQEVGRSERRGDGTINFYDQSGRMIGTSKGDKR
jgi:hypothetical protein